MGANEARHVLDMCADLGKVLGLELFTAAQALDLRRDMIHAAQQLAVESDVMRLARKIQGPALDDPDAVEVFLTEVEDLRAELAAAPAFAPGVVVAAAWRALREHIPFMARDRAMDGDVAAAVRLVEDDVVLNAARAAMGGG